MGIMNIGRVNIVITNRVLRYTYHKSTSIDGLVEHGEVELPKGTIQDGKINNKPVLLGIINQLVREHNWKRKKLNFAVPDDTVVIRQLQIPASLTKQEAMGYVETQIGNSFYLPFANPAIAIEFLDVDEANRNILLFAYPKEKLTSFEVIFEEAGLKPTVADLTSLSVYRYYYLSNYKERKDHVLHVHWNHDALVLTVFQNDQAIFTRYLKKDAVEEVNEELAVQIINEYIIEVNRIIDFYHYSITKGEAQVGQILLSGDFPFLSKAYTSLSAAVTIPIHSFKGEELPVKYIDVLGLALKQDS
ncbi:type IV pilus assembly protein PilM [Virgibacillus subterraneus]|uniref:Type IV pilus assembly protein PilM n=2 Tax=Virgibacillus subterraneus TaxID=621109 RepID=A0A1H9DCE2_9BACI|nr:type IV pilus assembly protein PilM [Virgibacillus subterraneus]